MVWTSEGKNPGQATCISHVPPDSMVISIFPFVFALRVVQSSLPTWRYLTCAPGIGSRERFFIAAMLSEKLGVACPISSLWLGLDSDLGEVMETTGLSSNS